MFQIPTGLYYFNYVLRLYWKPLMLQYVSGQQEQKASTVNVKHSRRLKILIASSCTQAILVLLKALILSTKINWLRNLADKRQRLKIQRLAVPCLTVCCQPNMLAS